MSGRLTRDTLCGMQIETDYLVVGAGASGLAFADSLLAESDVDVVIVDRRDRPGGHWQNAYPFVRLHSPSAFYGVNSIPLGHDRLIQDGPNAGFYEQASGEEIREYFERVVEALTATGRARFLGGHEHLGDTADGHRTRDLRTDETHTVDVRRSLVDARYLESSVPATHEPSFTVAPNAAFGPVNDLPELVDDYERFTVLGAGKTSADACLWLLEHGVDPDRIRWVRPRDAWFNDRAHLQPLDQVAGIIDGISLDAESAAHASDSTDLFDRLEDSGRHLRIDPDVRPTMFRATMLSQGELTAVRDIADVIRLGRVRAIEADRIVLDEGEAKTGSNVFHVDCSAEGLRAMPPIPVFEDGRIVIQQARHASPPFNAALIGFIEAHRETVEEKNRLTPPNPHPRRVEDWGPMMCRTWGTEFIWSSEPDITAWMASSRLNLLQALPEHAHEPRTQEALTRYIENVGPAMERLPTLA